MTDRAAAGLYLHVPFCSVVCPYCDFAVRTGNRERRRAFVERLQREIERAREESPVFAELEFDTVYLGGGTPSLLEPEDLARIFDALGKSLSLHPDVRVSLEANPEDVTEPRLQEWVGLGVNTLSLGVQSFDDGELKYLGRRHSSRQAVECMTLALASDIPTVSVDLIFGLPDRDAASWERTLRRTADLGPGHISCYQLTVHHGTPFYLRRERGELREISEPIMADLAGLTHRRLEERGYTAYEVSNFARSPRDHSAHNRKYWDHTPYLGLGPSAHSFDGRRRWWNEREVGPYQEKIDAGASPVAGCETLGPREVALESLMLGFRTRAGVDMARVHERTGFDLLAANRDQVADLVARDLVVEEEGRLRPTGAGMLLADSLARAFVLPGDVR